jgi:hypothetical protein
MIVLHASVVFYWGDCSLDCCPYTFQMLPLFCPLIFFSGFRIQLFDFLGAFETLRSTYENRSVQRSVRMEQLKNR